ncbi:MAG: beta-lactamase family protein [Chloroflexi bacterium]|nr:beta-lactamase family protein [Chloroflexota bacterium]
MNVHSSVARLLATTSLALVAAVAPASGGALAAQSTGPSAPAPAQLPARPAAVQPRSSTAANPAQAAAIAAIVQDAMAADHLRAVIVKVTEADQLLADQAFGESTPDVPATTDMHFRNGAVAFEYLATLLLEYVDEGRVSLDDTIDHWTPTLPEANQVTLKMLTNQTSGYPDFETDPAWTAAFNADPFHIWTYDERINYAFSRPAQFPPGSNWSYSHTNFMILGAILSQIGGQPLDVLLRDRVLGPMGLTGTVATRTSAIPEPVLHAFSSERRVALGIPPGNRFYEEATFWNTQWGTPDGANETSTIDDLVTTAVQVGSGALLSPASYDAMTGPHLLGFGHKQDNCDGSCFTQIPIYNFGLGVVRSGDWLLQNPLLSGQGATEAYLPAQQIAIAVAVTFTPAAFDDQGNYSNASDTLFRSIAAYLAPDAMPPKPPQ